MKLYKDGQLVGEFSTTELKELAGVDIEKAADVAVIGENFSKFDKVEIVCESYYGRANKIGETAEIKETYYLKELVYSVYENDGYVGVYPQSALKLIEEEPEEVLSYENVKVGELFEVADDGSNKFPTGTIVCSINSIQNDSHSGRFQDVVSGKTGFLKYNEIKRHTLEVLSEDNVKVGEYFVITDNSNGHRFATGEVIKAKGAHITQLKAERMDEAYWWFVYYADVRRATDAEIAEATKPKFEIGDVVKVVERFAVVRSEIDLDGDYYIRYIDSGQNRYYHPTHIRHATEEEKSHLQTLIGRGKDEYKVGDLVALFDRTPHGVGMYNGCIFEIASKNGASVMLLNNKTGNSFLHAAFGVEDIKLITPVEWRHDFLEEVK